MHNPERKEGFEGGELQPHQTAALLDFLSKSSHPQEIRKSMKDLLIGWAMSDTCESESGIERSSTVYDFFALYDLLEML